MQRSYLEYEHKKTTGNLLEYNRHNFVLVYSSYSIVVLILFDFPANLVQISFSACRAAEHTWTCSSSLARAKAYVMSTNYRKAFTGRRKLYGRILNFADPAMEEPAETANFMNERLKRNAEDSMMGFEELKPGTNSRIGWLLNMVPATVQDPTSNRSIQAVDLYFIGDNGEPDFRATIISRPYMYVSVHQDYLREAEVALRKTYRDQIAEIGFVKLEDISAPNHLASESQPTFLKVECNTISELFTIRKELLPRIDRNRDKAQRRGTADVVAPDQQIRSDGLDVILDIREFDVAPVNRLAIDMKINVGYWYRVTPSGSARTSKAQKPGDIGFFKDDTELNTTSAIELASAHLEKMSEMVERASPVVLAFDIECTKKPLKFPDPDAGDEVMMISWMVDGRGYLVINRETFSADIENFEYAPHKDFRGDFEVFNEPNEKRTLERFFTEVRIAAPRVFVTYNGDFFDWIFIEKRAAYLDLDMGKEIGMRSIGEDIGGQETRGRTAVHMDVFHWVNRDSYLPQGSRGLKAVTRTLLGFEPEEIPPEEMMEAAQKRPHDMAKYSVSDAVCTYYLYMKYVHPFTFSLCNIIPLSPDDVLRKGSGTLCEMLLMCQARDKNIIAPNKFNPSPAGKFSDDGRVMESETYIGGHVEALRTGIFRCDLPLNFEIDTDAILDLEKRLDDTLKFAISVEAKMKLETVTNYNEVKNQIMKDLGKLRETPKRHEKPLIYHLDVSAMYPNIILTNRLQPHAIVTSNDCAACDFNGMSECQRSMNWTWRGELYPATRGEAEMVFRRTVAEELDLQAKAEAALDEKRRSEGKNPSLQGKQRKQRLKNLMGIQVESGAPNFDNEMARKDPKFRKRLKDFCRTTYRKATTTKEDAKIATVCQRENPFYVDTVRAFRDRRYEYKALLKRQKKALSSIKSSGDKAAVTSAENLVVLYDSLQLAHKCILNSFYGYVMRRGARWYSMEMAGVVTHTGALIIKRAREFIDKVGLPLELDTDGIWCTLPSSFPGNYTFESSEGRKHTMSYIGTVFNADVAENFTNHQYQDLEDAKTMKYSIRSECSILFEVDGPYRAMVLPASMEEGKSIKKRYAVFNHDGSLAELKGFEIKRRGELKLIKNFQGEVFKQFLNGESLEQCYDSVGEICNKWLDVLTTKGEGMEDDDLLELLVEQNNMSKPLAEYVSAGQKSSAITCAKRMSAFLGPEVVRDGGLATMYIIAKKPDDAQVTERAIPSMVLDYKPVESRNRLLRKWTKVGQDADLSLRSIIDWDYYRGRLANAVLKIVSIPAALQFVDNPVPRIEYPPWLMKKIREYKDSRKQKKISSFFKALPKDAAPTKIKSYTLKDSAMNTKNLPMEDIEDMPLTSYTPALMAVRRANAVITSRKRQTKLAKKQFIYKEFRSHAEDPETRCDEMKEHLLSLINRPHPSKKSNYAGWLRYAKAVWKAQRAARVARYVKKRSREEAGIDVNESGTGSTWDKSKRLKSSKVKDVDYNPENFVADLRLADNQRVADGTFFKSRNTPLLGNGVFWQVVCVSPSPRSSGEFRLWVLPLKRDGSRFVPGNLHCIPVQIKRTLYIGSRSSEPPEIDGVTVELVKGMRFPRARNYMNVFRVELSEDRFQSIDDDDLSSKLKDADSVDAVYGSKIPLDYNAIISLGTLCRPLRQVERKLSTRQILSHGLRLQDIAPKDPKSVPYLRESLEDDSQSTVHQAFLYGSHATDGSTRATYLLVAPAAKLFIAFVVTPSGSTSVNLKRVWERLVTESGAQDEDSDGEVREAENQSPIQDLLPEGMEFIVRAFATREEAYEDLGRTLSDLRTSSGVGSKNKGTGYRTIMVAQWPIRNDSNADPSQLNSIPSDETKSPSKLCAALELESVVPAAKQFPIVSVSCNPNDGNYLPIGWETRALTTAAGRFAEMGAWLPNQLALSKFAGIPVGNVSLQDVHTQALDVLFGRELASNNHVLWASPSHEPDLGGAETDDNEFDEEHVAIVEHTTPGSHRVVCIDAELNDIAVATILSAELINRMEGADLAFEPAGKSSRDPETKSDDPSDVSKSDMKSIEDSHAPLDETSATAPAFRVLRDLVERWDGICTDAKHPETRQTCQELMSHIHRWVRVESSLLYDPLFARLLGWYARKLFRKLLGELQRLGVTVVYASLSRLILATPKSNTIDGLRYAGFLEKTIRENPIFKHIRFSPIHSVYSSMLFIDRYNFGALPAPEEEQILSNGISGEMVLSSSNVPGVRMMWDLVRYMPVPVAVLWGQVVEEFIRRPFVQRLKQIEDSDRKDQKPRGNVYAAEVRGLVRKLTGMLLERVQEIREKAPRLEFPDVPVNIPVSNTKRRNPALEFVRALCHVLGLDSVCGEEVYTLRGSLLRLLGVREFAKEAQFIDPALHVPLQDVVCTFCNNVVDIDLGRESFSSVKNSAGEEETKGSPWLCDNCGHPFDEKKMELELVRIAQKAFAAYQVQDLRCPRCKIVKEEKMLTHCPCSTAYELVMRKEDFLHRMRSMRSVAKYYKLKYLEQVTDWLVTQSE